ncbi:unnamed protein product [Spirodela intermedia]|uniref:Uncharacterized protein n=1 Tax=Spirodela intermedia TaxID=51605 RepID=A0A7I8LHX4_SPIIN|nr:unnamed protein product [Spirodela intermedia]
MKWVAKSSPAAVTCRLRRLSPGRAEKRRLCGSLAAVTRRRGAGWRWGLDGGGARVRELHPQVRAARGGSSSHLVRSQEVATRLPADRPLLDDGLFVDQSEMIYSMDCDPFIANRSAILVAMLRESR